MRFVNAYGRAALYATLIVAATLALLDLVSDGWRGFAELLPLLAVALYVFPIILALGLPTHLVFSAMRIASAGPYIGAGAALGAVAAVLFFRESTIAWFIVVAIGCGVAGSMAAFTFWRHYVAPVSGRLTSA